MISHPIQLVLLPATGEAATCLRIDANGTILSRTRLTSHVRADTPPATGAGHTRTYTVLAVPGMDIRTIDVELPARSKAQALAAAQLLLEEQVAGARDSLHIAIGDAPPDGGRQRLLAYTETATMQGWLDRAARLGIVADVVVPDFLLLPAPMEDGPVQVSTMDGRWLVRGPQQAFSSEPDLARQVLGERATVLHEDATQIEVLLATGAANPPINLLQYRFAPASSARGGRPAYRRAAVFATLLLLSPLVITAAQAVRYSIATSTLEHRAQDVARQWSAGDMGGDTHGAGDPASALQAPLARLRSNEDLPRMTAALFTAIGGTTAARLERLQYRDTGGLTGTLFHDTPDALDTIRDRLAADGLQLETTATQPVSGGYRSDVQLGPGT